MEPLTMGWQSQVVGAGGNCTSFILAPFCARLTGGSGGEREALAQRPRMRVGNFVAAGRGRVQLRPLLTTRWVIMLVMPMNCCDGLPSQVSSDWSLKSVCKFARVAWGKVE